MDTQEVDFIAEQPPKKLYVQVTFKRESEETVQREFAPLLSIHDLYPKFVVTMDPHFQDPIEGVRHIGLYQFLSDEHLNLGFHYKIQKVQKRHKFRRSYMSHSIDSVTTYNAWKSALMDADEPNSIINQLGSLYWDIGVYKAQISSWGYGKTEIAAIPPLFFDHFLKTFGLYVTASIRKLLEKSPKGRPEKSVISLQSLATEIQIKRTSYTRIVLFQAKNVTYSYEEVKAAHERYSREQLRAGNRTFWVPQALNESNTESLHLQWDSVTGTRSEDRTESDHLSEESLQQMEKQIKQFWKEIEYLANKFYLHASTSESRAIYTKTNEAALPSINKLITIALGCGSIYGQLCRILAIGAIQPLPYAQFDKWEGYKPNDFATKDELEKGWQAWENEIMSAINTELPLETKNALFYT